jgi:hypothetical protein
MAAQPAGLADAETLSSLCCCYSSAKQAMVGIAYLSTGRKAAALHGATRLTGLGALDATRCIARHRGVATTATTTTLLATAPTTTTTTLVASSHVC